ncbi:hypothetical protein [Pseudomonas phage vB_PseuGesM_254]|uniref:TMhelix containing protein n=1 Tax=Pseudomonas phage vB_PseuGesM_254 TaxID=3092638 RepID=A0AAX4G6E7_9CAUD|nr:hypothetical protein [Pseudomonas phage PseuGes_254]
MGWVYFTLYILIAVAVSVGSTIYYWKKFPNRYSPEKPCTDNKGSGIFTGVFWPVGLPILVLCIIYSKIVDLAVERVK